MDTRDLKAHGGPAFNAVRYFTPPRYARAKTATHSLDIVGGVIQNERKAVATRARHPGHDQRNSRTLRERPSVRATVMDS